MGRTVTLELPEHVAERAAAVAAAGNRRVEDVVRDWLVRLAADPPVDTLSDAEVLTLADSEMPTAEAEELAGLSADRNAGAITPEQHRRYHELMDVYRHRRVRMAQGQAEAVRRGLKPRGPYGEA